ncbi:galectin-2-like [Sardina pilchardus]|uniref:galectin-2-like n=1 Tax=Sardina pilchardus TaxID=27697 RepID=UPI002E161ACB
MGFAINIGHSWDSVALHFNPRFDEQTIVCNSYEEGSWQSEQRESSLPFRVQEEFKVTMEFNDKEFHIKLPSGQKIQFPNRFGDKEFKNVHVTGDVKIKDIKTIEEIHHMRQT